MLSPFCFVVASKGRIARSARQCAPGNPALVASRWPGCTKLAGLLHRRAGPTPARARRCGDSRAGAGARCRVCVRGPRRPIFTDP
ncbi:hypothetical protein C7H84_04580 [Burkholderia sp. Nafp2/4-1b]|nr:hypothetical protein C7H84_04580 [Burkholderia sp. Nafp2/4-1b]